MRIVILTILLASLTCTVTAKEIVLDSCSAVPEPGISLFPHVFGGKSETMLQQSDNTREALIELDEVAVAQWFISPIHCRVTGIEFFNRYYGTKNIAVWLDDGGAPSFPGGEFGNVSHTFTGNTWAWDDSLDTIGSTVELYFGEKFWVGIKSTPGRDPNIGLDNTNPDRGYARDSGNGWQWLPGQDLMVRVYLNDDWDPPYIDNRDPAPGETGVPYGANIKYHIKDDDAGVEYGSITSDTVVVTSSINGVLTGHYSVNYSDLHDVAVTFNPDSSFEENDVITVTVGPAGHAIKDALGNVMTTETWDFTVTSAGVESTSLGEIKATWK